MTEPTQHATQPPIVVQALASPTWPKVLLGVILGVAMTFVALRGADILMRPTSSQEKEEQLRSQREASLIQELELERATRKRIEAEGQLLKQELQRSQEAQRH